MSSSRTGRTDQTITPLLHTSTAPGAPHPVAWAPGALVWLVVLGSLTLAACGGEEDADYHLGANNRRAPGGTPSVTNDTSNGTNNATNNGDEPLNQLDSDEIVYLEEASGTLEVRSIAFAAQKNRFLFEPRAITGSSGQIATGDLAISGDRRRIIFVPSSAGEPQPLLSVTVSGADPIEIVAASDAPGVIHRPRTTADGDIVFVAGTTGNGTVYQVASLYRVQPRAHATPQRIDFDLGSCDVVQDVAPHPSSPSYLFIVREVCADFADAGLFQLDTRSGATGRIFAATSDDPTSTLSMPFVANYGHRLFVLGSGTFDVDGDFVWDAQGTGVFEISPTTGQYVGLATPDNPDLIIRAFTVTSDAQNLVFDLDRSGQRDLYIATSSGLGRLTNVGTARSPTSR